MKITKQKQHPAHSKKIIATFCIIAIILIAGVVYVFGFNGSLLGWQLRKSISQEEQHSTTTEDTTSNTGTKDDTAQGTDQTTDEIPVNETLIANFTTLTQSDGFITFSGEVNTDSTEGSCSITLTNTNDRPVTRTVAPKQVNNKATCGPIQIPESEFSFLGEWTATFRYYSGSTQTIVERKITIQ